MSRTTNRKVLTILAAAFMGVTQLAGCATPVIQNKSENGTGFKPELDTERTVELQIAGFFGNFEALDQVVNNFNEYYPNVNISYEQNGDSMLADYMQNNDYVDIFMTSDENVRYPDQTDRYVYDSCLDLSREGIDCSALQKEMVEIGTVDGKLVRIPMSQKLYGMVVNTSLLEKEGLKIPQNYKEFCEVCESLKEKGYTPIQGATTHVYSDMITNMAMDTIGTNAKLMKQIKDHDGNAAEQLRPVFERLEEIIEKGYTDFNVNSTYPEDNYDGAILTFLDGKVPFWICDTENFSGMKKRESKSESFSDHPFEYQFMYVPLGDEGAYAYVEPWYGFSVNKNSEEAGYAVEFLRFLTTEEQMNQLASIKGVPSAAKSSSDEKYAAIDGASNIIEEYRNNGELDSYIRSYIASVSANLGRGEYKNVDQAIEGLKQKIEN